MTTGLLIELTWHRAGTIPPDTDVIAGGLGEEPVVQLPLRIHRYPIDATPHGWWATFKVIEVQGVS